MNALSSRMTVALAAGTAWWLAASTALAHAPGVQKALPAVGEYFPLGIGHILTGFDHLLFLTALVLGSQRNRDVLYTVTAFTLAHSITLALGVLGLVHPNGLAVEVLIALSIAYVAFENLAGRGSGKPRYAVTLGFGLVHGLGFASALAEVGISTQRMLPSLLCFNLGVEAGQLMVLALLLPGVRWLQRGGALRLRALRGLSAVLVAVGVLWAGERVLQGGEATAVPTAEASAPPVLGSTAMARATVGGGQGVPRSVYPLAPRGAVAPQVVELCDVFSVLPRQRRAACSGSAPGVLLTSECTRMLDTSLRDGAVSVDETQADRCVADQSARYQSCDFMSRGTLAPSDSCRTLVRGQLAAGASCRSSLECGSGLRCKGGSPVELGTCAAPAPLGALCGLATDPLAAYVPNRDEDHPECAGRCVRNRCSPLPKP